MFIQYAVAIYSNSKKTLNEQKKKKEKQYNKQTWQKHNAKMGHKGERNKANKEKWKNTPKKAIKKRNDKLSIIHIYQDIH